MSFGPTDYTSIIGIKGHGKTTLSRKIQRSYPRIVIIDPMKEYRQVLEPARNVGRTSSLVGLNRGLNASFLYQRFTLVFEPNMWAEDLAKEVDAALQMIYERGNVCIVIEEFWMFCNPSWMPKAMKAICFTGRHQKLSVIITAQRPARVNKDFVSQCENKFFGFIEEPNDLDYIKELVGPDVVKLPTLPVGQFLWKRRRVASEIVGNR